jgi:Uncharacterized protein conserved in bacteria
VKDSSTPGSNVGVSGRFDAIDLMKFLAAILVVCIHANPLSSISKEMNFLLVQSVARLAVPFFFMTSGYLLYSKLKSRSNGRSYLIKYLKRIGLLYLLWTLVYMYWDINSFLSVHRSLIHYLQDAVFAGSHYHLWYFPSLIAAAILFYYGQKFLSIRNIVIIAAVLYLIGLLGDSYYGFIQDSSILSPLLSDYFGLFLTTRNGLFFGLLFLSLGAYQYESSFTLKPIRSFCLFLLSLVLLIGEVSFLKLYSEPRDFNMLLSLVPASFFLFHSIRNMKLPASSLDYKIFRDSSTLIYCSHGLFLLLYAEIIDPAAHSMMYFTLTLLSSLLLSVIILYLSHNKHMNRYLSLTY